MAGGPASPAPSWGGCTWRRSLRQSSSWKPSQSTGGREAGTLNSSTSKESQSLLKCILSAA
eukprot:7318089-Lingulodinium_polyedra.AAC.1